MEGNKEATAGCERRRVVRWEMLVIAWCASASSAVISHTTCCCGAPTAPRPAPRPATWGARVPSRVLRWRLMAFGKAGDGSTLLPFVPPPLRASARPGVNRLLLPRPLLWMASQMSSSRDPPHAATVLNSLESTTQWSPLRSGPRRRWRCVLKGIFWKAHCLSGWPSPPSEPLHRNRLTFAIYYLHRWHLSHLSPQGHTRNNNITAVPYSRS